MTSMEDQATTAEDAQTDEPTDDASDSSDSVEATPVGVDVESTEAGERGAAGLLAAAFASVGLTSPDRLDEVLSHEEREEQGAAAAEAAAQEEAAAAQAAAEQAAAEQAAAAEAEAAEAAAEEEEAAEDEVAVDLTPASPYDLPGEWFVIHSYSGYENKVKANLETRIHSMHMEGEIFDVVIPMEDVVEIKGGRKVTVPKKVFPGYILVRMYLTDDSWFAVRNTPGVTGFVGSGTKPVPLSRREVERILGVKKEEAVGKAAPRFQPAWGVGETVRVVDGPFADFNGVIEEINLDQSKVRVLVNIFGRETPVELNFEQIVKL
jgi:transcriptional antiterminator NusG